MSKLLGFLGLSKKAGMLVAGGDAVSEAARTGQARLLLLAEDAERDSVRRANRLAKSYSTPVLTVPATKLDMGSALGKQAVAICAITDIGFAAGIAERVSALSRDRETHAVYEKLTLSKKRQAERRIRKKAALTDQSPIVKKEARKIVKTNPKAGVSGSGRKEGPSGAKSRRSARRGHMERGHEV